MLTTFEQMTQDQRRACQVIEQSTGRGRYAAVELVETMNDEEVGQLVEIHEEMQKPPLGDSVRGLLNTHADRLAAEKTAAARESGLRSQESEANT